MRKYTGSASAIFQIVNDIRRSDPTLLTPSGWPVEVSTTGSFESDGSIHVWIAFPDLDLNGEKHTFVDFQLSRKKPVQSIEKFVYEVDGIISVVSRPRKDVFIKSFVHVKNFSLPCDDFVVPSGTSSDMIGWLKVASLAERRRWMRRNPPKIQICNEDSFRR